MKKISGILWAIAVIAVIVFIGFIIVAPTDVVRWQAFSVCLPVGYLSFIGAAALTIIEYMNSKKK